MVLIGRIKHRKKKPLKCQSFVVLPLKSMRTLILVSAGVDLGCLHWYIVRQKISDLPVSQVCLGQSSSVMAICVGICAVIQVASNCTGVCKVPTPCWVLHQARYQRLKRVIGHPPWVGVCSASRSRDIWQRDQPLESAQHWLSGCAILATGVGSVSMSGLLVQGSGPGGWDLAVTWARAAAKRGALRHPNTADQQSLRKHPCVLALFSVFLR